MGLPSQRSDDDGALVDEITRSIDGADDPKKVRSLLNAWWRYAGVRAAAGAEVDAEKFLAERSSLGLLELQLPAARAVIELEFAIANGPQGALPVVPSVDQSRVVDRPMSIVPLPAPAPEPVVEAEPEPVAEPEPMAEVVPAPVEEPEPVAEPVAEVEVETEPEYEGFEGEFEGAFEGEFEGAFEGEFEYLPEPGTEDGEPAAPVADVIAEQPVAELAETEPLAGIEDEPTAESELDGDPEDEDDVSLDEEPADQVEDDDEAPDDDEPAAAIPPALALVAEPEFEAELEPELEAEAEPEAEPESEAEPAPAYKLEPIFIAPAAAAVLQPAPQPEPEVEDDPEAEDEPEADATPEPDRDEQVAPIPVAALLADHDLVDPPEQWNALDEPVPISHFERFRRDRADSSEESAERAKLAVYAGLVVFFSLAVGGAMALSLVITHISLPGSDAAAIVAPWRAWLAIVTGIAGVVVATVIARRHDLGRVLIGPRVGLGGLAVTGIGLLAGSLIAAGAGGLVLLGGAALGAVRRA